MSTSDIAASLSISINTVKTHIRSIYDKLGVRSRNAAVLRGAQYHLLSEQSEWLVPH